MLQSVFGIRGEESRSKILSESYAEELEWVLSVTLSQTKLESAWRRFQAQYRAERAHSSNPEIP
jgi:hypothetical protein